MTTKVKKAIKTNTKVTNKAVTAPTRPGPTIDSILLFARRSASADKVSGKIRGGYATLWGSKVARHAAAKKGRIPVPSVTIDIINEKNRRVELFPNFEWLGAVIVSIDPVSGEYGMEGVALLPDGSLLLPRQPVVSKTFQWKPLPKNIPLSEECVGKFNLLGATLKSKTLFNDIRTEALNILNNVPETPAWLVNQLAGGVFNLKVPYLAAVMQQPVSQEKSRKLGNIFLFTPARFNRLFCNGAYKNAVMSVPYLLKGPKTPIEDVRPLLNNPFASV